jgi:hypothetical protein
LLCVYCFVAVLEQPPEDSKNVLVVLQPTAYLCSHRHRSIEWFGAVKLQSFSQRNAMKLRALCTFLVVLGLISGCSSGPKPIALSITAPTGAQALDLGQSFNITVTVSNDKLNKGATFSATGVGTLTNMTATGATYTAPTTGSGGTATITVASASDPTKTTTLMVTVTAPPSITTASLAAATEGTAYNATLAATGGAGTMNYSVTVGSLPAGLSLNSSTGAITGTPTGPNGAVSFTMQAKDSSTVTPQTSSKALSITVNLPAPPAFTTTSPLPAGVEFATYSQTLAASGYGPFTYALATGSTLPAGLSLTAVAITGAPTGPAGTNSFSLTVTDSSKPAQSATQSFSMTVSLPTAPSVTTTSLPNGTTGVAYNQTLAVSGGHGPFTWALVSGSGTLPPPLASIPSNGQISFTPNTTGVYTFKVQVTDSSNPAQTATSGVLSITVTAGPLAVSPQTLPTGAVNDTYPATSIGASGGVSPYTFSITSAAGTFPAGLAFNTSNGAITNSPSPTTAGTYNFTVQVKDSTNATASGNFTIVVNPALAITTTSPLPGGTQGTFYSDGLTASGGVTPYTWSIVTPGTGALPNGIQLSGSTISGISTVSGTFPFTVQVVDASGGTMTANLSLTLASAPALSVSTTSGSLPAGTQNAAYPATNLNATGGFQPYSWTITSGALPTGMNPLSSTGQISGTPTATGTFNFTVQVTDSASPTPNTATASLSITVSAAATTCDTTLTGKESLLLGDYAFGLSGFDSSGNPAFVGGVFTASGTAGSGNFTAGTLDMNLNAGVQSNLSFTTGSQYNLGQDGTGGYRGCMTIVTSAGTQHYAFSVDAVGAITANVASDGHMIDFDTTGPFTGGILRQATSSAFSNSSITGSWTFGISGPKNASSCSHSVCGGKFAAAGVLTFSGSNVSGVADSNDNGYTDNSSVFKAPYPTTAAGITLSSGPYNIGSNGRGTLTFTPAGGSSTVDFFVYVVSSSEVLLLGADSQATNDSYVGRAFKQSGTFNNSSLSGNHIIYASGVSTSTSGGSSTEFDLVSTTGTTFSFQGYQNDAGSLSDPTTNSGSGTFSVASNGRVTLTCAACGNLPVIYLFSANTGFFLNSDGHVSFGGFEPQSAGPFTTSSVSGTYGIGVIHPEVAGAKLQSGDVTFTPSTTSLAATFDDNAQGTLTPDSPGTDTYSVGSTGVVSLPTGCSFAGGTCNTLAVIISPTRGAAMDAKPANGTNHITPSINVLQQ